MECKAAMVIHVEIKISIRPAAYLLFYLLNNRLQAGRNRKLINNNAFISLQAVVEVSDIAAIRNLSLLQKPRTHQ